jgi:hypothetical protein
MARNKPPSDAVLTRAAELRAEGSTWEAVARKLRRSPETVRKWPAAYPDRWRAVLHHAERRLLTDTGAESVLILRTLLRSEDAKIRWHAAKSLLAVRIEFAKLDAKAAAADDAPPPPTSDTARLITLVEGLSDDELERLVADLPPPGPRPRAALPAPVGGTG